MNQMPHFDRTDADVLWQAADRAARAVPPAWPLNATVAVNPFLGQSHLSFAQTAELMGRLTGRNIAPPRALFREKIGQGLIRRQDLAAALERLGIAGIAAPEDLLEAAAKDGEPMEAIPDVAMLAAQISGIDWPRVVGERISAFASGYFDEGQALWAATRKGSAWSAWRLFAMHDLTPEIAGLQGFAAEVADAPLTAREAIAAAGEILGLERDPGTYFHQLLLELGGYAQYARQLQFSAERDGGMEWTVLDLLAIRLAFEAALRRIYGAKIDEQWTKALAAHRAPLVPSRERLIDAALQEAAEHAQAQLLVGNLEWSGMAQRVLPCTDNKRPAFQAAFCIDVRSEVFRRALETVELNAATLGFAGFFGIGTAHRGLASDLLEHRLPVLLPAGNISCVAVGEAEDRVARYRSRASRAFGRFRQAAVSSFAFVEATGPIYASKLLAGSLRLGKPKKTSSPMPRFADHSVAEKTQMAKAVLRAMSLTDNFARLVLLAGHGATTANNPFSSALQCGACGGHAGDVNARLLAMLLNENAVRDGLAADGILIPKDTLFIAGLHDTTTDDVTLYPEDVDASAHGEDLTRLKQCLEAAGRLARLERVKRLPRGTKATPHARSRDWAETRPEWGLAGCSSFIAAPRARTTGQSLDGRAFLHDYVWQKDEGFKILELILTAPVVVASWINLQYFGSSTAPELFGSGNKLLHNVVGGIGVFEGNGGPMRVGLPMQSVHDGSRLMHDPLRLAVIIDAPVDAVTDVLSRHPEVRKLFDNGWVKLFVLGENGTVTQRYAGHLDWQDAASPFGPLPSPGGDQTA